MKKTTAFHRLYGALFNFYSLFRRPDKNNVAFVSMHNENFNDSLGAVYDELKGEEGREFVFIDRRELSSVSGAVNFFLLGSRKLAGAGTIFLNDNFLPMAFMKIKPGVRVVQLWHGEGAFKRFGLSISAEPNVRCLESAADSRLTHVVTTSSSVASIYAEAFGVDEERVFPLGSARTDCFFDPAFMLSSRSDIEEAFPSLKGKRLILYAPTFRGDPERDEAILNNFDFESFLKDIGDEYALLVRLHPQIHSDAALPFGVIDATEWPDARQLCAACEILITDYSSICMSFALMGKKTVFFSYDLDYYKDSRDFYFDYENYVPGPVVKTSGELAKAVKAPLDEGKLQQFRSFNFDCIEGGSAKRIVEKFFG